MDTIKNPQLNLSTIINIESRFNAKIITENDIVEIDFFISSIVGIKDYIKSFILTNGFNSISDFLNSIQGDRTDKKIQIAAVNGMLRGSLSFLKNYVLNKKFVE